MPDFTQYANGDVIANSGGGNAASYPMVTVLENTYDTSRGTVTNGDVCTEFLKIPAGSFVHNVALTVIGAEAAVTVSVGDSDDPDGYVAAQSIATAGRFAGAGALVVASGTFYDEDTWLQFTVGGADLTVGTFKVSAVVANVG